MALSEGCPPLSLHLAVAHQHLSMVEYMLRKPGDVNARDVSGNTALHLAGVACSSGHEYLKLVSLLLQHGADPTIRNAAGQTPMQLTLLGKLPGNLSTARTKFCEALVQLITAGAPVNVTLPQLHCYPVMALTGPHNAPVGGCGGGTAPASLCSHCSNPSNPPQPFAGTAGPHESHGSQTAASALLPRSKADDLVVAPAGSIRSPTAQCLPPGSLQEEPQTFLTWAVSEMQDIHLVRTILASYLVHHEEQLPAALAASLPRTRSAEVALALLSAQSDMQLSPACVQHLLHLGLSALSVQLCVEAASRLQGSRSAHKRQLQCMLRSLLPVEDCCAVLKRILLARETELLQWTVHHAPRDVVTRAAVIPGQQRAWLKTVSGQDRRLKSSCCPASSSVTEMAVDAWLVIASELSWPVLNAQLQTSSSHEMYKPLRAIEVLRDAGAAFHANIFDTCMQRLGPSCPYVQRPRQAGPSAAIRSSYRGIYLAAAGLKPWSPTEHRLLPAPLKAAVQTILLATAVGGRTTGVRTLTVALPGSSTPAQGAFQGMVAHSGHHTNQAGARSCTSPITSYSSLDTLASATASQVVPESSPASQTAAAAAAEDVAGGHCMQDSDVESVASRLSSCLSAMSTMTLPVPSLPPSQEPLPPLPHDLLLRVIGFLAAEPSHWLQASAQPIRRTHGMPVELSHRGSPSKPVVPKYFYAN